MILEPQETFPLWVSKMMEELKITNDRSSRIKTGLYIHTIKQWRSGYSLPQLRTLIKLTENLSRRTGESPQDILDTIMESIPEWRRINGK